MNQELNVRTKAIIFLGENISVNFSDRGLGNGFLGSTFKAQETKGKKIDFLYTNNFCSSKDTIMKVKR